MTGNRALLKNFVAKFLGIVRFGNDHVAKITIYGDLIHDKVIIQHVYFVEGLGDNLFSSGQFCDNYLEVAFHKHSCIVRTLEGVDILNGSRDSNLYQIVLNELMAPKSICLLAKATSSQAWLWHRHFSHLNFKTINDLAQRDLVRGLPKLSF